MRRIIITRNITLDGVVDAEQSCFDVTADTEHGREPTAVPAEHAADPDADLTPWPAGAVTALGDAVHAMPPTGGMAAVTAIRDADVLAEELLLVRKRTPPN